MVDHLDEMKVWMIRTGEVEKQKEKKKIKGLSFIIILLQHLV